MVEHNEFAHRYSREKCYDRADVCDVRFDHIEESVWEIKDSIKNLRNMLWAQITATTVALIGYIAAQII